MLRQMQAQRNALSSADLRTFKKAYALEVVYYNWPMLERTALTSTRNIAFVGLVGTVFPHHREQTLAPISVQLNQLYRNALETEANTWGLTVYVDNLKVFVRPLQQKPPFMEEWEF